MNPYLVGLKKAQTACGASPNDTNLIMLRLGRDRESAPGGNIAYIPWNQRKIEKEKEKENSVWVLVYTVYTM